MFWNFLVSLSDAARGVSMPMKTLRKFAAYSSSSSSGSSARLMLASVESRSG